MNLEKYYAAPIFKSIKSTHTVRYQNEFERKLMKYFDAVTKISDYFQPLMSIVLPDAINDYSVEIDFWLEYKDGHVDLVHIENKNSLEVIKQNTEMKIPMDLDGFGLIIIQKGKMTRPSIENLRFDFPDATVECYSKWVH